MELSKQTPPFNHEFRFLVLKVVAVVSIMFLMISRPGWHEDSVAAELIETIGAVLIIVCIAGRLWSTLYIGGHKNLRLVTSGPFSTTRNPLYFFSTAGAVGIGFSFGSVLAGAALGAMVASILWFTARREAQYLSLKFGSHYERYSQHTPFFWPNPHLYRELQEAQFSPSALKRAFLDSLLFLTVFPSVDLAHYLHTADILPSVVTLY